jgi:ABC-type bacteriocin/lantibiotic exporter with double-glycine peptidase domain
MKRIKTSFTPQQEARDCGIACLLSLIRYYGGDNNFDELRRISGTSLTGTTLLGLYQAAKQIGFNADGWDANMEALLQHPSPCILHVTLPGNLQHYVVYYGKSITQNETTLIIGDPARGIEKMQIQEFENMWQSKKCLTLIPNNFFVKKKASNNAKKKWLLKLLERDYPLLLVAGALGVVIAALGLTLSIYSQKLIDDILPNKNDQKLYVGLLLVFALLLVKEAIGSLRSYFLLRQSNEFNTRISDAFYTRLLYLPKNFFDTRKIGELTARLTDTTRIQRTISQAAGNLILDTIVIIVTTGFIFNYSKQSGYFALFSLPFFFVLVYTNNKKIMQGQRRVMSEYAQTEANYISTLNGIETIKNHNKEPLFTAQNRRLYQRYQIGIFQLGRIQLKLSLIINALAALFLCGLLLYLGRKVFSNELKAGELMAIMGMFGSLLPSVANLALFSISFNEAKIAFERMYEFASIDTTNRGDQKMQLFESIQIQNISFRFAGRSKLLNDICFEANKGEIVALMGENGCGKSTITQLLLKNYTYENGAIFVNGSVELNNISTESWRKIIATVPQQIHVFNTTILENIAFEDSHQNSEKVIDFLTAHGFMSFFHHFPQSYMTLVGEEGINLSGGQKQLIALARALYHEPQLLVLDEATSAMDRTSELFVLQLLQRLKHKMSVIFITHRLHVLKQFCNRIYVLDNGCISAAGNHEQLLTSSNLYSMYWNDLLNRQTVADTIS